MGAGRAGAANWRRPRCCPAPPSQPSVPGGLGRWTRGSGGGGGNAGWEVSVRPTGRRGFSPQPLPPDLSELGEWAGSACLPGEAADLGGAGASGGPGSGSRPDLAGALDAPRGPAGTGSVCRGSVCPLEVCGSEGPRGRGRAPSKREADRTRPGGIAAPSLVPRSRGERPAGGRCSDTEVRPGASQLQWEMQLSPRPEDSCRHDHCLPFLCSDRMGNRTQQPLY